MMTHTDNTPELLLSDQEALLTLKNHYTGQAIFDSVIHKKEKLIIECTLILNQLLDLQKNDTDEEQTKQFNHILEQMHEIISSIETLNKSTEEEFKNQIQHLNESIKLFNGMINLDKFNEKISTLTYGKDLFTFMDSLGDFLTGTAILFRAWHSTVTSAISHVKHIFYPIHAVFVILTMLINFFIRVAELLKTNRSHATLTKEEALRQQQLEDAKVLLKTSTLFRFLTFTLQLLSILAFAGVITSGLGVIFMASATLATWIDETLSEEKKIRDAKKKFQRPENNPLTEKDNDELNLLNEKMSRARWNAVFKSISVISAILVACGVILPAGPILGMIGLSMLAIAPIKALLSQANASKEKSETAWRIFSASGIFLIACLPIPIVGPALTLMGIAISSIAALKYVYSSSLIQSYFPAKKIELVERSKEKFEEKKEENFEEKFEEKKRKGAEEKLAPQISFYARVAAIPPTVQEIKSTVQEIKSQEKQESRQKERVTYKRLCRGRVNNGAKPKDTSPPPTTPKEIKP